MALLCPFLDFYLHCQCNLDFLPGSASALRRVVSMKTCPKYQNDVEEIEIKERQALNVIVFLRTAVPNLLFANVPRKIKNRNLINP